MKTNTITYDSVRAYYDGNEEETYTLFLNKTLGKAELFVGEDAAIEITKQVNEFIGKYNARKYEHVLNNDGDSLGVIVDIYYKGDCIDSLTIWFDDYQ